MTVGTPIIRTRVRDLAEQTRFYTRVLGRPPEFQGPGSAVWVTDNPRVRFEIAVDVGPAQFLPGAGPV